MSFGHSPARFARTRRPSVPQTGTLSTSAQRRAARSSRIAVYPRCRRAQASTSLSPRPRSHATRSSPTGPTAHTNAEASVCNQRRAGSSAGPVKISPATPVGIMMSAASWLSQSRWPSLPRQIKGEAFTTHLANSAMWTIRSRLRVRVRPVRLGTAIPGNVREPQ